MPENITVSLDNYKKLHKAYTEAAARGMETIVVWEGSPIILPYLYYVLEYMETVSSEIKQYAVKNKIERRR